MKKVLCLILLLPAVFAYSQQKKQKEVSQNIKVESTSDAQYLGGEDKLYQDIHFKLKYSKEAIDKKIDTQLMVSFMVETDSTVKNIKVMNDPGAGVGDSVRVFLRNSRFVPARMNGTPLKTQLMLNLPISAH